MARILRILFLHLCTFFLLGSVVLAQQVPPSFTYQGRLLNSAGTAPLTSTVNLKFQILNPAADCLLYEETQTGIDLSTTSGVFSVQVGSNTGSGKRTINDPGMTMTQVFADGSRAAASANCTPGYTPAAGEGRLLRVTVIDGATTTVLTPDQSISAQPYATVAERLRNFAPTDLLRLNTIANLTQANIENLVNGSDASTLHHHDGRYVQIGATGSTNLGSGTTYTTGKIGVGTSTPATDIEIEQLNPALRLESTASGGGTGQIQFYSGSTERARIESPEGSSELRFYTGSTLAMTIDNNQNASFAGNVISSGFVDLGDYTNATETSTLSPYLTPCAAGCTGTMWYNTDLNQVRYWNGATMLSLASDASQLSLDGSDTMAGDLKMGGYNITNVGSITATSGVLGGVTLTGGYIQNLSAPVASGDATNKAYVDAQISALSSSSSGAYLLQDGTTALTANWSVGGYDFLNVGNISLAAQKTVNLGVFDAAQETTLLGTLGAGDAGKFWYNSATGELKYWNGAAAQVVGLSGAGMQSLNGENGSAQTFGVPGTSGTAPAWSSSSNVHTLNIPMANTASVTAGLISKTEYDNFAQKQDGDAQLTDIAAITPASTSGYLLGSDGTNLLM
ncbi:MAG: hypothetical protein KDD22_00485, partial [Bdellovibrionales bacterium]|nr:hypothetical protein [Bdellovibrionales bacterium]